MRYLLLFLISFSTFAGYMTRVDIEDCDKGNRVFHLKKNTCIGECLEVSKNYQCETYKIANEMIDDLESKNYGPETDAESCVDEETCQEELLKLTCSDGYEKFIALNYSQVYCTEFLGYNKKESGRKIVAVDPIKKSAYETLQAAKKAQSDAIGLVLKDMSFGKNIYAAVRVMSKVKGLNKGQRKTLKSNLSEIRDSLLDGDICSARADIAGLTADGTLIKAENLTSVLAAIDAKYTCE